MPTSIRSADDATVRLFDVVVVLWLVLWLVLGTWSGYTIWRVSSVGDTVTNSGRALTSAGEALQEVGELPVVGVEAAGLGAQTVATAEDITARGQEIKGQLRRLSVLLGLSIVFIPTTPIIGLYLPLRLARRREVGAIQRTLATSGRDAGLDRYLAERAIAVLPYMTVREISSDPWQDIADGRARALADAELRRLGLRSPVPADRSAG